MDDTALARCDKALEHYRKAVASEPENPTALFCKAVMSARRGELFDALKVKQTMGAGKETFLYAPVRIVNLVKTSIVVEPPIRRLNHAMNYDMNNVMNRAMNNAMPCCGGS